MPEGIRAAARKHFTTARRKRCWTHFMRNLLSKVSHADKDRVAKDMIAARKIEEYAMCLQEAKRMATCHEERYPGVARQIREQIEDTLAVHGLPKEHRRRMHTTNMMERLLRELKRRTRAVGIFPDDASCDRLVGAQFWNFMRPGNANPPAT